MRLRFFKESCDACFRKCFFSYPSKEILGGISYSFESGCYVIFGENGCGKSTLLKLVGGLLSSLVFSFWVSKTFCHYFYMVSFLNHFLYL